MKIIKHYTELTEKTQDKKIAYLKYRTGKVKHELWLKSRKSKALSLLLIMIILF